MDEKGFILEKKYTKKLGYDVFINEKLDLYVVIMRETTYGFFDEKHFIIRFGDELEIETPIEVVEKTLKGVLFETFDLTKNDVDLIKSNVDYIMLKTKEPIDKKLLDDVLNDELSKYHYPISVEVEEGKKLLPYIERAVNEYHQLLEIDREILGLEDGLIRIGTLSSYSSQWLPRIIKEFQELYPRVRFRLRQGDYTTVPEYIRQGSVDFGFVSPDAETVKGLETIFITEGSHSAILPAGHRLAQRKRIDLKELVSEPYIQLETGCLSEPIEMFHKLGLEPEIELRMHDNFSVCTMVEAGIGVSITPDLALRKMAFSIVAIPTRPDIKRKVAFAMKEKKALPVASRRFLDFFMARFSELN